MNYHPILWTYARIAESWCGADTPSEERMARARASLEYALNTDQLAIDEVNWLCMAEALGGRFDESDFEDVYNNGWEGQPELRKAIEEIVYPIPFDKPLEDYL